LDPLGGGEEEMAEGKSMPDVTTAALLGTGEGRIVINACKPDQLSCFLKTNELTWFTEALKDGLLGKSASFEGMIGVFNLYTYVYEAVQQTAEKFNVLQDPTITLLAGVGSFPIAHAGSSAGIEQMDSLPDIGVIERVSLEDSEQLLSKIELQRIRGDSITVGNISSSSGVAIGRSASPSASGSAPSGSDAAGQHQLLALLGSDVFTMDELQALSLLIGLNWVSLQGEDQRSKAIALVLTAEMTGKLDDLKSKVVLLKSEFKDVLG
jgi:hypothetical protein